ncbi:hypothetical protein OIE73_36650 [Streptomyces hirsutus]|uniref:Uncharacterized protein n=1 Tax=Streptomyces hirsutus TaxID=35620 RepID=A0ABZ1GZV2_9ACTN|nr:hypothetical protein [Streptomyces hirsutus]WSD10690.1 hypothetical protein OIE73_36650 [Streptomyces hirsutus]
MTTPKRLPEDGLKKTATSFDGLRQDRADNLAAGLFGSYTSVRCPRAALGPLTGTPAEPAARPRPAGGGRKPLPS